MKSPSRSFFALMLAGLLALAGLVAPLGRVTPADAAIWEAAGPSDLRQANRAPLAFSTFVGGAADEAMFDLFVDRNGDFYIVGVTQNAGYPVTPGAFDTSFNGGPPTPADAYVTKARRDGSGLVFATFLGGSGCCAETALAVTVDRDGFIYVVGETESADFPTTPGAFDQTFNGLVDAFVSKLTPDGSALVFATFLGGNAQDSATGVAVDANGFVYVTGVTESANFPTTPGALDPVQDVNQSAFLVKLRPDGSALEFSTFLWGRPQAIGLDRDGNPVVGGWTGSANLPTTPGVFDQTFNGGEDGYVLKVRADGTVLVYSTFLGASQSDRVSDIVVDDGAVYAVVVTTSPDFPTTPGAFDRSLGGPGDYLVLKLQAEATDLAYATYLGGSQDEYAHVVALAVDQHGRAYVTGFTASPDFPTTPDALSRRLSGDEDAFVAVLDERGRTLLFSTFLGGSGDDSGRGIAIGADGAVYVAGDASSRDFPTTPGAFDRSYNGGTRDSFVAKLVLAQAVPPGGPGGGPVVGGPGAVDEPNRRKPTEEQRQQRRRTDTSSLDDTRTEGHVVGVRCTLAASVPTVERGFVAKPDAVPYVLIAMRDGVQQVLLLYDTASQCASVQVGDYLQADGEKIHEQLFEAHNATVTRGGQRVH